MAKKLENVLVNVKGNALNLKIDMTAYAERALTDAIRTGENNDGSYRVAGGGSQYINIEGMEGVMVKLDVIVSHKKYQAILENERAKATALQAMAEIEQLRKAAVGTDAEKLTVLNGIDPAVFAQALALAQTLQAQAAAK
jgi:hypothetical protein